MKKISIASEIVDIELAFDSSKIENLSYEDIDSESQSLLNDSNLWVKDITTWIQFITAQVDWICPEVVRNASTISLGLELIDDVKMKELNYLWMQKNSSTDVLSFPLIDETCLFPCDEYVELGDILISVTTARRQAIAHNHVLGYELKWLATHGLLHLLGWDHIDNASLNKMLRAQEQLLAINVSL